MIRITALRWVPPQVQGLVRDFRVRWALEEAGLPYAVRLLDAEEQHAEAYRELQPFAQVPSYQDDDIALFESGAIVMHVAERSDVLMPKDARARARVRMWMFAALNSVEPPIMALFFFGFREPAEGIGAAPRDAVVALVEQRLDALAVQLRDREYLESSFSAADLLMSAVLRILRDTELVASRPVLDAYRRRCEARPAFAKAIADQLADFAANAPDTAS